MLMEILICLNFIHCSICLNRCFNARRAVSWDMSYQPCFVSTHRGANLQRLGLYQGSDTCPCLSHSAIFVHILQPLFKQPLLLQALTENQILPLVFAEQPTVPIEGMQRRCLAEVPPFPEMLFEARMLQLLPHRHVRRPVPRECFDLVDQSPDMTRDGWTCHCRLLLRS